MQKVNAKHLTMDVNLEDSLTLDQAIVADFEQSADIVGNSEISLEDSDHITLPTNMEFENIESQPILMETDTMIGGADEYSIQLSPSMPVLGGEEEVFSHESMDTIMNANETDTHTDVVEPKFFEQGQHDGDIIIETKQTIKAEKKFVMTKQLLPVQQSLINQSTRSKEIPIAPKPTMTISGSKAFAIPMQGKTVIANQANKSILAPKNRKVVLMPSVGGQTYKLVTGGGVQYLKDDKGRIYTAKRVGDKQVLTRVGDVPLEGIQKVVQPSKSVFAKVVSGSSNQSRLIPIQPSNQPFIIQKLSPKSSPKKVYKSVPHIVSVSPARLQAASKQPAARTKKVLIAPQNLQVVHQPSKATQIGSVGGQQSQTLQVNVPGKGVQYIRVIHNSGSQPVKSIIGQNFHGKFVLRADSKVPVTKSLITQNKQPVFINKIAPKPISSKVVKIAPASSATLANSLQNIQQKPTPGRSLLLLQLQKEGNQNAQVEQSCGENSAEVPAPGVPVVEIAEDVEPQELPAKRMEVDISEEDDKLNLQDLMCSEEASRDGKAITDVSEILSDNLAIAITENGEKEQSETVEIEINESQVHEGEVIEVQIPTKVEPIYDEHEDSASSGDERREYSSSEDSPVDVKDHNIFEQFILNATSMKRKDMETTASYMNIDPTSLLYSPGNKLDPVDVQRASQLKIRSRRRCNCHKSQCLKLYCDCFASGEFCNGCNCCSCYNNLEHEELRQKAIRSCLERNPKAFRPKIGKGKDGPLPARQHTKGCNCRRSGCLKNYCECFEAKIACSSMCRCMGCRNLDDSNTSASQVRQKTIYNANQPSRPACSFLTNEVIDAVCGCLVAAGSEHAAGATRTDPTAAVAVLRELSRCLRDVVSASSRARPQILAL